MSRGSIAFQYIKVSWGLKTMNELNGNSNLIPHSLNT